jgi:hypothetical protein
MDDKPLAVDFRFSDGTEFQVSNTTKMAMAGDVGPKYRHQDGNQEPCKDHPKISEKYGARAEWVEYRVRK